MIPVFNLQAVRSEVLHQLTLCPVSVKSGSKFTPFRTSSQFRGSGHQERQQLISSSNELTECNALMGEDAPNRDANTAHDSLTLEVTNPE